MKIKYNKTISKILLYGGIASLLIACGLIIVVFCLLWSVI